MEKIVRRFLFTALALVMIIAYGCKKDDLGGDKNVNLIIKLIDGPFPTDLVAEANVTISSILIKNVDENEGIPFLTLTEEEMAFNLLDLTNGVTATLVDMEIPAGTYDEIRMIVSEATILLKDETVYDLKIPSGEQTGIKIKLEPLVIITENLGAEILLDFDVSQSFVVQGNPDTPAGIKGFIFKPVVRSANMDLTGSLSGLITDTEEIPLEGVQISVLSGEEVVSTSFTTEKGEYKILGLPAGTYKVMAEHPDYVPATVEEVEIEAGEETEVDFKLEEG
jgi:hypothetical protein